MQKQLEVKKLANILVCDDDKEIVEAISIYLSQENYQIFKAYDGEQAIEVLKQEDIQLLIIDIMMPKLDTTFNIVTNFIGCFINLYKILINKLFGKSFQALHII